MPLVDVYIKLGFAKSKSECRKLIEGELLSFLNCCITRGKQGFKRLKGSRCILIFASSNHAPDAES